MKEQIKQYIPISTQFVLFIICFSDSRSGFSADKSNKHPAASVLPLLARHRISIRTFCLISAIVRKELWLLRVNYTVLEMVHPSGWCQLQQLFTGKKMRITRLSRDFQGVACSQICCMGFFLDKCPGWWLHIQTCSTMVFRLFFHSLRA